MQENFKKIFQEKLKSIFQNNYKIAVFGGGISGNAVISFLKKHKQSFVLIDSKKPENSEPYLNETMAELNLSQFSLIIKSPGIKPDHPILQKAKNLEIPVLSEIDLASLFFKGKIIGITGTDGKSTTTALTFHILNNIYPNSKMGGNIGVPFIEFCEEDLEFAVLELSSYQLEDSIIIKTFSSTILNIANDHLERHKTIENYISAKMKIIDYNNPDHKIILNSRQANLFRLPKDSYAQIQYFGNNTNDNAYIDIEKFIIKTQNYSYDISKFPLEGYHNLENLSASILLIESVSNNYSLIEKSFQNFPGLDHRFQTFFTYKNSIFINDSKSTNTHSLISGLDGFNKDVKLIIILGGIPKKEPVEPLLKRLRSLECEIFMFGDMVNSWYNQFLKYDLNTKKFNDLNEIVLEIKKSIISESIDYVIFSPGGASFDLYRNFEERGNHFMKLVKETFTY